MGFEVSHATREDEEALLKLWRQFTDHLSEYDGRYDHQPDADERWLSYFRNQILDSELGTVVIAKRDGELVGVVEVRVRGGHPIFRLQDHGYITGIYVQKEEEAREISRALLLEVENWLENCPRNIQFYRVDTVSQDDYIQELLGDAGLTVVEQVYEKWL